MIKIFSNEVDKFYGVVEKWEDLTLRDATHILNEITNTNLRKPLKLLNEKNINVF